ncbi:hypothetical protein [Roseibium sp. Sym1]|uniref:hypothetical protein n=1 Tax=Roseibium sp. Sym1 TaxID=3016006 RepID=UPI0022B48FE1|nr:hypothetical protein [Roseibium sp. Sym1]
MVTQTASHRSGRRRSLRPEEARLCEQLSHWMLKDMVARLSALSPAPDLLCDEGQSNFELCCDALARLGLLTWENTYWRVLRQPEDLPNLPDTVCRADLDALLDGFACHAEYVDVLAPLGTNVVSSDPALRRVCEAMSACGYMEKHEDKKFSRREVWCWAPRFLPWLICHGGAALMDIEPVSDETLEAAVADMGESFRDNLSSNHFSDQPSFIRFCLCRRRDGVWLTDKELSNTQDRDLPSEDWDLPLAAALYRRFHDKAG